MTSALLIAFVVGTFAYLGDYFRRKLLAERFREYTVKDLTGKDSSNTEEVLACVKSKDLACERSIIKYIPHLYQKTPGVMVRAIVKDMEGNPDIFFIRRDGRTLLDATCSSPAKYWQGDEKFVCQIH